MTLDRENISDRLATAGYIADRDIATALWLMDFLKRPLLLEGEAGVGKTEVAKALAAVHDAELIRLQCYEGLDQNAALYEWNYQRQLLAIKMREGIGENADAIEEHIFSERYLLERPLLAAIRREKPPVLLIDEVDRADEEFEAFLLELLSDFQVSIPELGTISAVVPPTVILTSNSERNLGDALKRRCLHLHIGFPEQKLEERIVESRVPGISQTLRKQLVGFIHSLRTLDLKKQPSVSETIDWARVLVLLQAGELGHEMVKDTLNVLLKYESDVEAALPHVTTFVANANRQNVFG
jgi:MoxR-like ATPase